MRALAVPPITARLLLIVAAISAVGVLPPFSRLEVPFAHVALSGDLHVFLHSPPTPLPALQISISRLQSGTAHFLEDIPVRPNPDSNENLTSFTIQCGHFPQGGTYLLRIRGADENLTEAESVQDSKLSGVLDVRWPSPKLSLTPENIQTFPEHSVTGIVEFPEVMCTPVEGSGVVLPEFWMEVNYCGQGGSVLCSGPGVPVYSAPVRGLPGRHELPLRCELFGLAGTYALTLRPSIPAPTLPSSTAYLKASWSEQFVLNVHARSVLPCDAHAGGLAVLLQYPACVLERADRVRVFAREPSTAGALRYVAELRVARGVHAIRFPCDLFSERYPEYCFVYVTQAVNGAVADVRQECLPTLPSLDGAVTAGWGPWSAWSPCSGRCGGARARYRYCDSPPPPYGTPYCKGAAVESEACSSGGEAGDCPWEEDDGEGSEAACRCGCVLRLGNTVRQISASAQTCRGRTFWLLQAAANRVVRLRVQKIRLPCGAQWLKARDGGSPGAALLAQWPSENMDSQEADAVEDEEVVTSTGRDLLIEFFSDELLAAGAACPGGFVASASQIDASTANTSSTVAAAPLPFGRGQGPLSAAGPGAFLGALLAALLLLAAPAACWVVMRALHATRKYQRANDCDSLADSDLGPGSAAALGGSRGTLLSEVLSLRRLRAGGGGGGTHRLLRESRDMEERAQGGEENHPTAGSWSSGSSVTLAPTTAASDPATSSSAPADCPNTRPGSGGSLPATQAQPEHTSPLRRSRTCSPSPRQDEERKVAHRGPVNSLISDGESVSVDMSASERDSDQSSDVRARRVTGTPRFPRRSTVSENGSRCESINTLTNGCYSPALSTTSCARVRTTGGKERKERRNLRLKAPPSDLSLATQPEFELDYYDYNVTNAGAVPGSYLGMDPQFLVWIPPLQEDKEKHSHTYEEILPRVNADPGSNTESPEDYIEQPSIARHRFKQQEDTPTSSPSLDRKLLTKMNIVHPLNFSISDLAPSYKETSMDGCKNIYQRREPPSVVSIPLRDFSKNNVKMNESWGEKETRCEKSPCEKFDNIEDIQFADEDSDSSNEVKFTVHDNKNVTSKSVPKEYVKT